MLCHAWNAFVCFWIKEATQQLHFMTAVISLSIVPCPVSFYCCQYSSLYWLNCQFWKVIDNTLDSRRVELALPGEINVNRTAPWDSAQPKGSTSRQHGFHTWKQILCTKNWSWNSFKEKGEMVVFRQNNFSKANISKKC